LLKGKYNRLSESNKTRKIKARLFGKLRIYINGEYKKIYFFNFINIIFFKIVNSMRKKNSA
jgi:hypothetical protein